MGRLIGLLFVFAVSTPAHAHDTGDARAALKVAADGAVHLDLKLARIDAAELLGLPDDAPEAALDAILHEIPEKLGTWIALAGEPTPCLWDDVRVAPEGVRGLAITARAACPVAPELTVSWPAATRTRLDVTLTASITPPEGEARLTILNREKPSEVVPLRSPASMDTGGFLLHGIEHMLTGWDHLAFLLALVLACARLRRLLLVVTAFTLAHSVTLALAVTGVVTADPGLVEPIIAGSIGVAALVGLVRLAAGRLAWPGSPRPMPNPVLELGICFGFGLIHGLGFAGLLAELVPPGQVWVPLLVFNLGVELGQIGAVAVAFPLLVWVGRSPAARPIFGVILTGLVGLGATVAVQRVLG